MKKILIIALAYFLSESVWAGQSSIDKLVEEQIQRSLKANPNLQVVRAEGDFVILEEKPKARNVYKHADGSISIQ